jgi:orotidine-5'-phosphate decarboxylase
MKERIIIALDTQDSRELEYYLENLKDAHYFKVGMEAFYTFGPSLIERLKKANKAVFLDLKLHDIPNTVAKSLKSLSQLDIDMINVHALGGSEMLKKARSIVPHGIKLIGVTVLTSHTQENIQQELKVNASLDDYVLNLAQLTKDSGLDGIVCSALEVPKIKEVLGSEFLTVTPGIRLNNDQKDDQKRVLTPKDAFNNGSDYIVMGRSITKSDNPNQTFLNILEDLK